MTRCDKICFKILPNLGSCYNLAYLARFLFQNLVTSCQILCSSKNLVRYWQDLGKILERFLERFFYRAASLCSHIHSPYCLILQPNLPQCLSCCLMFWVELAPRGLGCGFSKIVFFSVTLCPSTGWVGRQTKRTIG